MLGLKKSHSRWSAGGTGNATCNEWQLAVIKGPIQSVATPASPHAVQACRLQGTATRKASYLFPELRNNRPRTPEPCRSIRRAVPAWRRPQAAQLSAMLLPRCRWQAPPRSPLWTPLLPRRRPPLPHRPPWLPRLVFFPPPFLPQPLLRLLLLWRLPQLPAWHRSPAWHLPSPLQRRRRLPPQRPPPVHSGSGSCRAT